MRLIKVKDGTDKHKLRGFDGVVIGELTITYDAHEKTCLIDITKKGAVMTRVEIGRQ